jgi:hypothetical protein
MAAATPTAAEKGTSRMNPMTVQSAIRMHLSQAGPCTLENLLGRLPEFSWSEIFSVVDQLSREGSLILRRPTRSGYEVSIPAASEAAQSGPSHVCDHRVRFEDCAAS